MWAWASMPAFHVSRGVIRMVWILYVFAMVMLYGGLMAMVNHK